MVVPPSRQAKSGQRPPTSLSDATGAVVGAVVTQAIYVRVNMDSGGRRSEALQSGYRCEFRKLTDHGSGWHCEGRLTWEPPDPIRPGEDRVALLEPVVPIHWATLRAGEVLTIHEGPHTVGVVKVLSVDN